MATRSNIKIVTGETTLWIYRHWDGYPEVTGVDVATKLEESKTMTDFVSSLLNDKDGSGNHLYEVTTEMHGDIEYRYTVEADCFMFKSTKNILIHQFVHEFGRKSQKFICNGKPSGIIKQYS